jgi:hypothetical protein
MDKEHGQLIIHFGDLVPAMGEKVQVENEKSGFNTTFCGYIQLNIRPIQFFCYTPLQVVQDDPVKEFVFELL